MAVVEESTTPAVSPAPVVEAPPAPKAPTAPESAAPQSVEATPVNDAPTLGAVDKDSKGNTWDERIHATTKGVNKDGSYKLKRGVDKDLAKQILADQLAGGNAAESEPAATPTAVEPPPVSAPVDAAPQPVVPAPAPVTPPPVAAAPAPAPVPAAPAAVETDYKRLSIIAVNGVTKHGVEFGSFAPVFAMLDATGFDDLDPDAYQEFHKIVDDWDCDLQEIEEVKEDLAKCSPQAVEGFATYVQNFGGTADQYWTVARNHLPQMLAQLREYLGQWKAVANG